MNGVRIEGEPTINGIRTKRTGELAGALADGQDPTLDKDDNLEEWRIAKVVARKVKRMRYDGYQAKECAAFAYREVKRMALEVK